MSFDYAKNIFTNRTTGKGSPADDNNQQGKAILDLHARLTSLEEIPPGGVDEAAVLEILQPFDARLSAVESGGGGARLFTPYAGSINGPLSVTTPRLKIVAPIESAFRLREVVSEVVEAPLGQSANFDVKYRLPGAAATDIKTITQGDPLSIAPGAVSSSKKGLDIVLPAGTTLWSECSQAGSSSAPGVDWTVRFRGVPA